MARIRRFLVYMDRFEADPYKLIWRMREALEHDGGWGSKLHAGWYSIDSENPNHPTGYLGDHCSTWVRARNVETALRIGMKRIYVEMNYGFADYPWDKFTHVFEWEKTCPQWKKHNAI
jgi:hypothetical protein